jgi:3-hydroxybutyryl-CoA dehydrogenase
VVGGGTMGAGIAHALLLAGSWVRLVEADPPAARRSRARVQQVVEGSVARGMVEYGGKVMTRLEVTCDVAEVADAGLVVEAVPEEPGRKLAVLGAVERVVSRDAVIATSTSSIAVSELAAGLDHPDRLVGMHFFNPVPASRLVEVVVGAGTREGLGDQVAAWSARLGKTPVVVRDAPGFASSRLGVLLGLEAIRTLEDGVADAASVDELMTLGYGHPVGPLRLTDLVGLDVRLGVARYLERELGPRFAPPELLVRLVERGHLGRKSGRGFYDWTQEDHA